jgi:hypothetical protein
MDTPPSPSPPDELLETGSDDSTGSWQHVEPEANESHHPRVGLAHPPPSCVEELHQEESRLQLGTALRTPRPTARLPDGASEQEVAGWLGGALGGAAPFDAGARLQDSLRSGAGLL